MKLAALKADPKVILTVGLTAELKADPMDNLKAVSTVEEKNVLKGSM